jgi:pimeloyl-ACP methyl ester carboxylesterase
LPLILTHGWPGSTFEFLEAIGPLSDPASFGGSPDDAFDVVVPSLPGFGFSSKPIGKPIGRATVAPLWNQLMTEVLGYARYGAQGGDMSGATTVLLACQFPASLVGIHMNGVGPGGPLPPEADRTAEERAWVSKLNAYLETERDYLNEHQHKPQTIALLSPTIRWALPPGS